jgi:hypothetical protein
VFAIRRSASFFSSLHPLLNARTASIRAGTNVSSASLRKSVMAALRRSQGVSAAAFLNEIFDRTQQTRL